jgi:hypothetical protein
MVYFDGISTVFYVLDFGLETNTAFRGSQGVTDMDVRLQNHAVQCVPVVSTKLIDVTEIEECRLLECFTMWLL